MIDPVLRGIILILSGLVVLAVILGLRATFYFWSLVRQDEAEQGTRSSRLLRWVTYLITTIEVSGMYVAFLTVARLLDDQSRYPWAPYVSGIVVVAVTSIPYVLMRRVESLRKHARHLRERNGAGQPGEMR